MMVSVVISSDTRTPCTNLDLGTIARTPTTYRGPDDALTMSGNAWLVTLQHDVNL